MSISRSHNVRNIIFVGFCCFLLLMVAIAFGLRSEGISHIPSSSVTSRNTEPAYDQVTINQLDMIGVPHQAGIVTLPSEDLRAALTPQVVTASWSQDAIDFKVPPGLTAIILEDEPLFQVTTAVAFEIKLIPVVGVYDRCELLAESRQWASIYALDNRMAGAMMAADCARVIHSINPAAIILLNSTTPPDEPTGRLGKSLREQIREVGFSDNQIGGGTKDAFSKQLIESLVKILQ